MVWSVIAKYQHILAGDSTDTENYIYALHLDAIHQIALYDRSVHMTVCDIRPEQASLLQNIELCSIIRCGPR